MCIYTYTHTVCYNTHIALRHTCVLTSIFLHTRACAHSCRPTFIKFWTLKKRWCVVLGTKAMTGRDFFFFSFFSERLWNSENGTCTFSFLNASFVVRSSSSTTQLAKQRQLLQATIGQFCFSLVFFRQIVARTVLETLRVVTGQTEDVSAVLNVMSKLADDVG